MPELVATLERRLIRSIMAPVAVSRQVVEAALRRCRALNGGSYSVQVHLPWDRGGSGEPLAASATRRVVARVGRGWGGTAA